VLHLYVLHNSISFNVPFLLSEMNYSTYTTDDLIARIQELERDKEKPSSNLLRSSASLPNLPSQQDDNTPTPVLNLHPPPLTNLLVITPTPVPLIHTTVGNNADTTAALQNTSSACPEENDFPTVFENVHPDVMIELIKKCSDIGSNRRKEFYKSYSKWSTLKPDQKNNVVCWFKNLPEITQKSLIQQGKTTVLEERRYTFNNTTKDDIVRLIHLNRHPDTIIHWSRTKSILTRQQLDSRNSLSRNAREPANPWEALAVIYNDYVNFTPQKLMVKYIEGPNGKPEKRIPVEPEKEWEFLYTTCHELDPTNMSRARVTRDGEWIKLRSL